MRTIIKGLLPVYTGLMKSLIKKKFKNTVFQIIKIKAGLLENLELNLNKAKDSMKFT